MASEDGALCALEAQLGLLLRLLQQQALSGGDGRITTPNVPSKNLA